MISRIYLSALFTCMVSPILILSDKSTEQNENMCKKIGSKPNFHPQMLVGPQWRTYYTWNVKGNPYCLSLKFYNVNAWVVSRFYRDMGQYLKQQPLWNAPILYVTLGPSMEQMLLLNDTGPAGRVHGVPNLIRDNNFMKRKQKNILPLLQFQMKLLENGKFLLIVDCVGGVATLSKRDLVPPSRTEIESVAKKLALGNGATTCKTRDKR